MVSDFQYYELLETIHTTTDIRHKSRHDEHYCG